MGVLMTLKQVRLNKKTLEPGTKIRVENEQELISKGYARRLTKDECRTILDEYAAYAEMVFNKTDTTHKQQKPRDTKKVQNEQLSLFK